jgi:hypothetical protein
MLVYQIYIQLEGWVYQAQKVTTPDATTFALVSDTDMDSLGRRFNLWNITYPV